MLLSVLNGPDQDSLPPVQWPWYSIKLVLIIYGTLFLKRKRLTEPVWKASTQYEAPTNDHSLCQEWSGFHLCRDTDGFLGHDTAVSVMWAESAHTRSGFKAHGQCCATTHFHALSRVSIHFYTFTFILQRIFKVGFHLHTGLLGRLGLVFPPPCLITNNLSETHSTHLSFFAGERLAILLCLPLESICLIIYPFIMLDSFAGEPILPGTFFHTPNSTIHSAGVWGCSTGSEPIISGNCSRKVRRSPALSRSAKNGCCLSRSGRGANCSDPPPSPPRRQLGPLAWGRSYLRGGALGWGPAQRRSNTIYKNK